MKKIFLLCITALFLSGLSVNAQTKPITFGVKVGMNLSDLKGDDTDGFRDRFAGIAGITVDFAITNNLYLMTGLEYAEKGAKITFEEEVGDDIYGKVESRVSPSYLQLPVHIGLKLGIGDNGNTKFVLHGGGYAAYGVRGRVTNSWIGEDGWVTEKSDLFTDNGFKRFDCGVGVGGGFEFNHFVVDGGFNYGLLDVSKSEGKVRNINGYVTLGFKF
ncbi:porin family protein [Dysgonomonas sp. 511]|uniref:porin family protein n=1 Tax=Dysgonomonas sp. 511 TaxID=2302930 RepID=UPI0013D210ED|nr:porin family protein [Dysgonomonas sp. 511]NDV79775.1 PorT family protein [Dysgonomonas sp. 511]